MHRLIVITSGFTASQTYFTPSNCIPFRSRRTSMHTTPPKLHTEIPFKRPVGLEFKLKPELKTNWCTLNQTSRLSSYHTHYKLDKRVVRRMYTMHTFSHEATNQQKRFIPSTSVVLPQWITWPSALGAKINICDPFDNVYMYGFTLQRPIVVLGASRA